LRVLARDAEARVREALSQQLKHCRTIPHDLALRQAKDVDSVARPVLSFSQVLTAEDFVEVIKSQAGADKMTAVVERIMTHHETFGAEFEHDDLEYLFARVGAVAAEGISVN
jgi:uncharacterized protein (DUF2336 family)